MYFIIFNVVCMALDKILNTKIQFSMYINIYRDSYCKKKFQQAISAPQGR